MRRHADRPPLPGHGRLEEYTVPFLFSAFCLLLMALVAIWTAWGLAPALAACWALDRLISRAGQR